MGSLGQINGSGSMMSLEAEPSPEETSERFSNLQSLLGTLQKCARGSGITSDASPKKEACDSAQRFPFMKLPPELRQQICAYAIGIPEATPNKKVILSEHQRPENDNYTWSIWPDDILSDSVSQSFTVVDGPHLSILRTCRQVYAEAQHIFYSDHTLAFANTISLLSFLQAIGPKRRQQLSGIFFAWCGAEAKEAFRLLKDCTSLKSVVFTIPCKIPVGYAALCEVRGLEHASVCAIIHANPIEVDDRYWPDRRSTAREEQCRYINRSYLCNCIGASNSPTLRRGIAHLEQAMMRPSRQRKPTDVPPDNKTRKSRRRKSEKEQLQEGMHSFYWLMKKYRTPYTQDLY